MTRQSSIFVRELGLNRRGTVLLLHGFGVDHRIWIPAIIPLLSQYKFILPDLRGFGRSGHLPFDHSCSISNFANDIELLIQKRKLSKFYLGGFSLGGLISMELLRRSDTRVIKFLNIDQSPKPLSCQVWPYGLGGKEKGLEFVSRAEDILSQLDEGTRQLRFNQLPMNLRKSIYDSFSLFLTTSVSGRFEKRLSPLIFQVPLLRDQLSIFRNWHVTLQIMRDYLVKDYDYRSTLSNLVLPVTYLVGMKSEIYPAEGQKITHDLTPLSEMVAFADSGHDLMLKEPIKFARELKRFLSFENSI